MGSQPDKGNAKHAVAYIISSLVTYKPGYDIHAEAVPMSRSVVVEMQGREVSSWDDNEVVGVYFRDEFVVPDSELGYDHLIRCLEMWLQAYVHEFERHEADEWLKMGGRRVHDPHANDGDPSEDGG